MSKTMETNNETQAPSDPMEVETNGTPPSVANAQQQQEDVVDTTAAEEKAYENATAGEDGETATSSPMENDNDDAKAEEEEAEKPEGSSMAESDSSSSTDIGSDDDDDDDDDMHDDFGNDKKVTKDPNDIVAEAVTLKEQGNDFFKAGDLNKASRSYRKGSSVLKPLNKSNTGDDQVKALLVNLQTNLSMVCFKQNKPKMSRDVATKALEIDSTNVKALYRRAAAKRKMGDWTDAKEDLKKALKLDPTNVAVKKELHALKKEIDTSKRTQREGLQKAFASSKKTGSFLYSDREEELKRKEEERKKKEQQEKEETEKRKIEWTKEMDQRVSNGEEHVPFETWDKERKEKEQKAKDALKKEEEERKRKEREARRAAKKAAKAAAKQENESSDEELTAEELKLLRGYKKTSDGRTTSYFNREQSEHEKQMIGDITPQRLETAGSDVPQSVPLSTSTPSSGVQSTSAAAGGKGRASLWNQAGTWEEKDTTEWCTTHLKHLLNTTTASYSSSQKNNIKAIVTENTNFTGDASVALTGGKKRYIFDFHTTVKYEIRDDDSDDVLATGKIKLPDISSTGAHDEDELEVNVFAWDKSPTAEFTADSNACRDNLVDSIRKSVSSFVKDFNEHY